MSDKLKFPREKALCVAVDLIEILEPYCDRIYYAGSLRRRKDEVGDIEILFIPRTEVRLDGLFDSITVSLADEVIEHLLKKHILIKRLSSYGRAAWGLQNKLAVHVATGIPIDLFATTIPNWWNALVCRTGGRDNNLLITQTALRQGWSFEAYGSGFHRLDHSERHDTASERDVFEFIGLSYKEPWERL